MTADRRRGAAQERKMRAPVRYHLLTIDRPHDLPGPQRDHADSAGSSGSHDAAKGSRQLTVDS